MRRCFFFIIKTSDIIFFLPCLKGRGQGYAHGHRLSLQNKFVGSTLN